MQCFKRSLMVLIPVLALGACASLSDQDRTMLASASENAQQAKLLAQQALDASRAAQASASSAAESANAAAAAATAANEKSDRMFQRSLRKVAPTGQGG